jgi:hypothetical protein
MTYEGRGDFMISIYRKLATASLLVSMVPGTLGAQTASTKTRAKSSTRRTSAAAPAVTAEDIKALRDALAAQQQQIEQLRQELARRDETARANEEAARTAQTSANDAASRASAAETSASQQASTVEGLKQELENVKLNQQNAALSSQDDQKRIVAAEGTLGRFRFTGDVRLRGEGFIQGHDACGTACPDRWRARIRARLGFEGKVNENFIAGIFLATGTVANGNPTFTDPVSTNETLTSFFERKAIGLDRAYVTYQPQNLKWLQMTGGKFAVNWQKAVTTIDNDLNPEGFTMKLSKDFSNVPVLKNLTVQPVLLFFNEVGGGADSNAVGGQFLTRWQLGRNVTVTPSYMLLNWNGADAIAQAAAPVLLPQPATPAAGAPLPQPTTQNLRVINANLVTNATRVVGTGTSQRREFVSDFMYSDLVANVAVKTPWSRFPVTVVGEYLDNLRVRNNQGTLYFGEFSIGQTRNKNDVQLGYSFAHIEQDAVISQFNESDYRAPTNLVQHRTFFNWAVTPAVTASYTLFIGRTLNTALQNAARAPGIPVGAEEPWLKRMQMDLVYRF